MKSHAAAARCLFGDDDAIVDDVIQHKVDVNLSGKMKALLSIAAKVQQSGKHVLQEDVDAARHAGADDRDIHDVVLIAATFCMFNRYVDGLASYTPQSDDEYLAMGQRMAEKGYTAPSPVQ